MKRTILFVLSLLAGLMFINAGLNKFLNYMPAPKDMPDKMMKMGTAFAEIGWLMPLKVGCRPLQRCPKNQHRGIGVRSESEVADTSTDSNSVGLGAIYAVNRRPL